MDITLILEHIDLHERLSTYSVSEEVSYRKIITTLDEVEHPYQGHSRPIISFSLFPSTEEEDQSLFLVLNKLVFPATFSLRGNNVTKRVRVDGGFESTFLLRSIDGKRRYRGGEIVLRSL